MVVATAAAANLGEKVRKTLRRRRDGEGLAVDRGRGKRRSQVPYAWRV
jgi:hypothetical protein